MKLLLFISAVVLVLASCGRKYTYTVLSYQEMPSGHIEAVSSQEFDHAVHVGDTVCRELHSGLNYVEVVVE